MDEAFDRMAAKTNRLVQKEFLGFITQLQGVWINRKEIWQHLQNIHKEFTAIPPKDEVLVPQTDEAEVQWQANFEFIKKLTLEMPYADVWPLIMSWPSLRDAFNTEDWYRAKTKRDYIDVYLAYFLETGNKSDLVQMHDIGQKQLLEITEAGTSKIAGKLLFWKLVYQQQSKLRAMVRQMNERGQTKGKTIVEVQRLDMHTIADNLPENTNIQYHGSRLAYESNNRIHIQQWNFGNEIKPMISIPRSDTAFFAGQYFVVFPKTENYEKGTLLTNYPRVYDLEGGVWKWSDSVIPQYQSNLEEVLFEDLKKLEIDRDEVWSYSFNKGSGSPANDVQIVMLGVLLGEGAVLRLFALEVNFKRLYHAVLANRAKSSGSLKAALKASIVVTEVDVATFLLTDFPRTYRLADDYFTEKTDKVDTVRVGKFPHEIIGTHTRPRGAPELVGPFHAATIEEKAYHTLALVEISPQPPNWRSNVWLEETWAARVKLPNGENKQMDISGTVKYWKFSTNFIFPEPVSGDRPLLDFFSYNGYPVQLKVKDNEVYQGDGSRDLEEWGRERNTNFYHRLWKIVAMCDRYAVILEEYFPPKRSDLRWRYHRIDLWKLFSRYLQTEEKLIYLPLSCNFCGSPTDKGCKLCQQTPYCSDECQQHEWGEHRLQCKK